MKVSLTTAIPRHVWRGFALALVLGAAACGESTDDSESSESFTKVKPVGADNPGSLVIRLPVEVGPTAVTDLRVDGKPAKPEVLIKDLAVGTHEVGAYGLRGSVTIKPGETANYDLAAVRVVMPKERTFGLNGELRSNGDHLASTPTRIEVRLDQAAVSVEKLTTEVMVVPVGQFSLAWGNGDGTSLIALPGGKMTIVDLGSPEGRHLARLVAPTARELPDVGRPYDQWGLGRAANGRAKLKMPTGGTLLVGTRQQDQTEQVQVGYQKLDVRFAEPGQAPLEYTFGRIDVEDVQVTKNGTTKTVPGTYVIRLAGKTIVEAVTNTGIDVLPGTYTVDTRYESAEAEGGWKTTSQKVTID